MTQLSYHTRLDEQIAPSNRTFLSRDGRHQLTHGSSTDWNQVYTSADIVFADPPAIEENSSVEEAEQFFERWAEWLEVNTKADAALVVVYRERKGSGLLKSAIGTSVLLRFGWKIVREFVWRYSDAEFHRAHPNFSLMHVFRRGNMPMAAEADLRYKDLFLAKPPAQGDQNKFIMEMPIEVPKMALELFDAPGKDFLVLDPFAGTGVVAKVAAQLGIRSVSIELNPDQFEILKNDVWFDLPTSLEEPVKGGMIQLRMDLREESK